ncbi:MAG: transcription elongation protein SprT [Planctomycetota bacterium]
MTREEWLVACVDGLRPDFEAIGYPLPKRIRASCSWPSKSALAAKKKRIGEAWAAECSGDKTFETFISPVLHDPLEVAAVLVHELVHCAVGLKERHGKRFRDCAVKMGLEGRMTATVAGEALKKRLNALIREVGRYPHAELKHSNAPPKQTTRMLKVECRDCGCIVRMTQKWLDEAGPPTCACGGEMNRDDE